MNYLSHADHPLCWVYLLEAAIPQVITLMPLQQLETKHLKQNALKPSIILLINHILDLSMGYQFMHLGTTKN